MGLKTHRIPFIQFRRFASHVNRRDGKLLFVKWTCKSYVTPAHLSSHYFPFSIWLFRALSASFISFQSNPDYNSMSCIYTWWIRFPFLIEFAIWSRRSRPYRERYENAKCQPYYMNFIMHLNSILLPCCHTNNKCHSEKFSIWLPVVYIMLMCIAKSSCHWKFLTKMGNVELFWLYQFTPQTTIKRTANTDTVTEVNWIHRLRRMMKEGTTKHAGAKCIQAKALRALYQTDTQYVCFCFNVLLFFKSSIQQ